MPVIDMVGNEREKLAELHTEQLHLIEHYRRTDFAHLRVDVRTPKPRLCEQSLFQTATDIWS